MTRLIFCLNFLVILMVFEPGRKAMAGDTKLRFLTTGAGWGHAAMHDKGISPLLYNGSQFAGSLGFLKKSPAVTNHLQLNVLMGELSSSQREVLQAGIKNYRFEIDYAHRRMVWHDTTLRIKVFAGGVWNTVQTNRAHSLYSNSASTSWFFSSLALSGLSEYNFKFLNRKFTLESGLDIPLATFAVRPVYTMTFQEGYIMGHDGIKAFLKSGKLYFPDKFRGAGTRLSLFYHLSNNNCIALEYRWNYHEFKDINPVKEARHQLMLKALFNF